MNYNDILKHIEDLCNNSTLNFNEKFNKLEREFSKSDFNDILNILDFVGIIPEFFNHDSTEEKLFSKFTDSLLARAISFLNIESRVLDARGDSADVLGKTSEYIIIGDAKAFRMSRTAKNQKDYKVTALNQWRTQKEYKADYAVLVAPFYQYPSTSSQIYSQAIRLNVTLLSYTHLKYLLIHNETLKKKSLKPIWEVAKSLRDLDSKSRKKAKLYWKKINQTIIKLTETDNKEFNKSKQLLKENLISKEKIEVGYWESVKENEENRVSHLSHEAALNELKALTKIESNKKIKVIEKTAKTDLDGFFII